MTEFWPASRFPFVPLFLVAALDLRARSYDGLRDFQYGGPHVSPFLFLGRFLRIITECSSMVDVRLVIVEKCRGCVGEVSVKCR